MEIVGVEETAIARLQFRHGDNVGKPLIKDYHKYNLDT